MAAGEVRPKVAVRIRDTISYRNGRYAAKVIDALQAGDVGHATGDLRRLQGI